MFYVLNFKNHMFVSADYPEEAILIGSTLAEDYALDEDELEIVNALDDCRYMLEDFKQMWS